MADELRAIRGIESGSSPAMAQALTRLVVLPFRVLRPDRRDRLPRLQPARRDRHVAVRHHRSLIVRSSAVAARFATETPDLKALAAEADVDRVVMGTLLRAGDQLRATAQLVDAPGGTLLTSHTVQASLGDLFGLQDDIARRVADALSLPLAGTPAQSPDRPADPQAYELYLRANELARTYDGITAARDLYQQCLELDPRFAPAWARLGRCHRIVGKYIDPDPGSDARAEDALRRALAINPRLSLAHKFYANLEADIGQASAALRRLLGEASRHGNDPELFAGLVHACRYCGLFEQSVAAHAEARRLDPNVTTSVEQTLMMMGDVDAMLAMQAPKLIAGADDGIRVIALGLSGRRDEARVRLATMRESSRIPLFVGWMDYIEAWLDGSARNVTGEIERAGLGALKIQDDPEAIFQEGLDVLRRRRARARARRSRARGGQGLLRRADADPLAAVRRPARRAALPGAARLRRGRPRPRPGRVSRGGRRAPARRRRRVAGAMKTFARDECRDGDRPAAPAGARRQRAPVGHDDAAPDDLSLRGRLPHGVRRGGAERRQHGHDAQRDQVDRALRADAHGRRASRRCRSSISGPRGRRPARSPPTWRRWRRSSASIRRRDRGGAPWPRHPIFGRMSQRAWLRWAYLHMDHHLRQFGA